MPSISFGSLNTVEGKTTLSGGQSGIDTATLVEALTGAKRLPAVALETNITTNKSKISELNTLESKLKTLRDSLNKLRAPGGFGATTDVFASRLAFMTSSDGSTSSIYLGVVAKNGAAIKNYDIEITNLAVAESRKSISFTSRTASAVNANGDETAGFFSAGTFQINGSDITLSQGESLNSVAAKINAKSGTTNVEASILKVSDTDFRLIISSTKTGTDNAIVITDAIDSVFVAGNPANIFATVTAAENAMFTLDGEPITRQTNTISDVVDNVTFSLFQETDELVTTPTIKVEIGKDAQKVSEAIVAFIDAYNDFRLFFGKQNERDDDNRFVDTALLNDSSLLDSISASILSNLTSVVGVSNPFAVDDGTTAPKNLTNLGITFNDFQGDEENGIATATSILELDAAILADKIESNFDAVKKLFAFSLTSTSSNLNLFSRGNISSNEAYTIVVDDTQAPGFKAYVSHIDGNALATPFYLNYDTSNPNVTATITGSGALNGFEFFYRGDGTSTESFSTQIAEGRKDYTIAVDGTADTARVTHIRGLALTTAIDLTYTASSTGGAITSAATSTLGELTFLHFGSGTEAIDVSYSQGFADKVYNYLDGVVEGGAGAVQGLVQDEIDNLTESNDNFQTTIERIDAQVVTYREQLLIKFAALEAAIAASNSVLDLLEAQTNARNNSN